MTKTCKHCNITFDLDSYAKRQAGGKINECADCVEELGTETAVRYLGFASGHDGEATDLTIRSYGSEAERQASASAWQADPQKS